MKIQEVLLALLILPFFCAFSAKQNHPGQNFKKLEWLIGSWKRSDTKPGQSGSESWTKRAAYHLEGKGYTLKGRDTIFSEKLKLIISGKDILYIVEGADGQGPVPFKLTQMSSDGFICENPEHDFPKKITYSLTGSSLRASISGNGQNVDFNFVKE